MVSAQHLRRRISSSSTRQETWHECRRRSNTDSICTAHRYNLFSGIRHWSNRSGCRAHGKSPPNAYVAGSHLLCHDDVISTRCVSYIIYLTAPDVPWTEKDGGALELYPVEGGKTAGVPACTPTTSILPEFNSMAMFIVQPGRSYHSVQEVMAQDKPRLSISGWFHAAEPPPSHGASSLQQIKNSQKLPRQVSSKGSSGGKILPSKEWISDAEQAYLAAWINPIYLRPDNFKLLKEKFDSEKAVQLIDFLKPDVAEKIRERIAGVTGPKPGWKLVGPPIKRRHLVLANVDSDETGLGDVRKRLFLSDAFAHFLARCPLSPF